MSINDYLEKKDIYTFEGKRGTKALIDILKDAGFEACKRVNESEADVIYNFLKDNAQAVELLANFVYDIYEDEIKESRPELFKESTHVEITGTCPCSNKGCCNKPNIIIRHHCDNDCEDICENSYETYCGNCKKSCYCDL